MAPEVQEVAGMEPTGFFLVHIGDPGLAQHLEEDTEPESVSTTVLCDAQIPHQVFHLSNRTRKVHFAEESVTVGR
jgi:hypothetical protein